MPSVFDDSIVFILDQCRKGCVKHGLDTGINTKGISMLFLDCFPRPTWILRVRKGPTDLYKHTGRIHLQNKG